MSFLYPVPPSVCSVQRIEVIEQADHQESKALSRPFALSQTI